MAGKYFDSGASEEFKAELDAYRRLRFRLDESESAGRMDEDLLDGIVVAEDRLMAAPPTSLFVILTKYEIFASHAMQLNPTWVATIRTDLMHLGGIDRSPLGPWLG